MITLKIRKTNPVFHVDFLKRSRNWIEIRGIQNRYGVSPTGLFHYGLSLSNTHDG